MSLGGCEKGWVGKVEVFSKGIERHRHHHLPVTVFGRKLDVSTQLSVLGVVGEQVQPSMVLGNRTQG